MEAIETENPKMDGVLPKEVYAQLVPEEEPELLSNIVRIFKDIPENSTIDIFDKIYEYFLGNFALAEGKDGGTFYTPATVVRYMAEVLNPQPGEKKFLDPACGFYVIIMLVVKSLIKSRFLVLLQTFKTIKYNNLCVVWNHLICRCL